MKVILLSLVFCAVITTCVAQKPDTSAHVVKNSRDGLSDPDNTISENILAFNRATIFSRSIEISDLTETFNNQGPITIFLPTDSAFNKLSKGKLDSLVKPESKFDLIALITYHALPGNISAKDIAREINREKGLAVFRTISGAALKAQFDEYKNIVLIDETGGKSILQGSDLKQRNGLIHLVSAPLIPKFKAI